MSKARNLSRLVVDGNGDVDAASLDNVPASDDASALTTGTLDIARIADGAVTATKLASTLDLTGKTVTLPSGTGGKVLQVVHQTYTPSTYSTTNTTSWTAWDLSASITPTNSSSYLIVMSNFHTRFYASGNDVAGYTGIFRDGTGIQDRFWTGDNLGKLGDVIWFPVNAAQLVRVPANSTSSTTFDIRYRNNTSGNYIGFIPYESSLTIWEIAA